MKPEHAKQGPKTVAEIEKYFKEEVRIIADTIDPSLQGFLKVDLTDKLPSERRKDVDTRFVNVDFVILGTQDLPDRTHVGLEEALKPLGIKHWHRYEFEEGKPLRLTPVYFTPAMDLRSVDTRIGEFKSIVAKINDNAPDIRGIIEEAVPAPSRVLSEKSITGSLRDLIANSLRGIADLIQGKGNGGKE